MKIEYDQEADAAYVYFIHPIKDKEAVRTSSVTENIFIDFDKNNKLLGLEILNASRVMKKELLLHTQ